MGRPTAARPLSAPPRQSRARFDIRLAGSADAAGVRRLLREHALPGDIALTLEREPDIDRAARTEGDRHQTMIAHESRNAGIAAIASRAERAVFINGRAARIGYLGQFRTALRGHRVASLLDEGFAFCRSLHADGDVRAYLTSIVADNHPARRLLCGCRSDSAPRFVPAGTLVTLAIPRRRARPAATIPSIHVRNGSIEMLDEIVDCLTRNGRRYQFAPIWTADDLLSDDRTPGLAPHDFLVATKAGRVVGCAALWDQRAFKQVVVRGYSPTIMRWRRLLNVVGPFFRLPALPAIGEPLSFVYLSHIAVDDDAADVTMALVAEARRQLRSDVSHLIAAFAERSPLFETASRAAFTRTYRSLLFLAHWPDGHAFVDSIDQRLPHPEIAIL